VTKETVAEKNSSPPRGAFSKGYRGRRGWVLPVPVRVLITSVSMSNRTF